jgi:activator of HSP90 ATPase
LNAKKEMMHVKTSNIRQKILIQATPMEIYEAYVDAKKHSEFTGSKATSNPEVNGEFTAWDGYIYGKNLELQPGKKITQEWSTTEWPKDQPPSRVEFTLKKTNTGTEINMLQSNVPAEQAAELKQGWIDFYWTPLKDYFKKPKTKKVKKAS